MAAKKDAATLAPAANDAYTGMLAISLCALIVGCVLLGFGGFLLLQNSASLKLPDNNKLWADTWKKKLTKPWEMPKAEGAIGASASAA